MQLGILILFDILNHFGNHARINDRLDWRVFCDRKNLSYPDQSIVLPEDVFTANALEEFIEVVQSVGRVEELLDLFCISIVDDKKFLFFLSGTLVINRSENVAHLFELFFPVFPSDVLGEFVSFLFEVFGFFLIRFEHANLSMNEKIYNLPANSK